VAAGARVWGKSWGRAEEAAHLNRRAGESLARGPGEHRRAAAGLGLDPESETGRRREVDADERAPRVIGRERRRAWGLTGPEALLGRGAGESGLRAELDVGLARKRGCGALGRGKTGATTDLASDEPKPTRAKTG
jgi:hypothetical protein